MARVNPLVGVAAVSTLGAALGLAVLAGAVGPEPDTQPLGAARSPLLEQVRVETRSPVVYDRCPLFGCSWRDTDGDGCTVREEVLARDLVDVDARGEGTCAIVGGRLADPITGRVLEDAKNADIEADHVLALDYVYGLGAELWTKAERVAFANDPANVWATWGRANASKGSRGPAQLIRHDCAVRGSACWDPDGDGVREPLMPRSQWCQFSSRFIRVVLKYDSQVGTPLAVTGPDKSALRTMQAECP